MATNITRQRIAYGLTEPLLSVGLEPILAKRDPTTADKAALGVEWINTDTKSIFFLASIEDNIATWVPITNIGTSPTFDADSGSATPAADILNIVGGAGIITSGAGNTITVSLTGGAPVDSVTGGNNITITGTAANPIVNVSGTTNHAVQVGNATNSLTSLAVGATNTVLLGATGANPSFGAVPNAALSNSSITLSNGQNITVTGSPVSLGGTATIALSGVVPIANGGTNASSMATTDGTVYFDGTRLVTTATGTAGQILTSGGPGVAPSYQTGGAASISITGNTGGALTGSSFTFTGGTTGLAFNGAGTTETLGGTLVVANGGTGVATIAAHSLLIGEGTSAIANTGAGTAGQVMVSGGAAADPAWVTPTAGTGLTVTENATTQSYALSVPVSIANGGTNATSMTNTNGTVYFDGTRLVTAAPSTAGFVLTSNGASAPTFQANGGAGGVTRLNGNSSFAVPVAGAIVVQASTGDGTARIAGSGGGSLTLGFTDGSGNVGTGSNTLSSLSGGSDNSVYGSGSGESISSGSFNSVFGSGAYNGTTGSYNTAIGFNSAENYATSESSNITINSNGTVGESNKLRIGAGTGTGNQQLNAAFVSGIQGITVTGTAVLISSSDQLGIAVSSQRFKNDIQPMADSSNVLYKLRPVTFTWDRNSAPGLEDASTDRQCGLIAEEVAQVMPQIVGFDKEGKPLNVNYGDLTSLLVNEIQKLSARIAALESKGSV